MLSLASSSSIRSDILKAAQIPFQIIQAAIDEDSLKASLMADGAGPRDVVDALAEFKARKGSNKTSGLVLGCDQVLVFGGKIYGKPKNQSELRDLMKLMMGKRHDLLTANVLYQDQKPIWRHVGRVTLTMRALSDQDLDNYINAHWDTVQYSAGGYTIETTPYLFSDIKGDWFDILGLSLDPLRGVLRMHGVTDSKRPKLAGVFGYPIAQSKSPTLHGYWLDQLNIPGFYTALECPSAYFAETVHLLAKLGFSGANVTMPHKDAAIKISDTQTEAAKTIGVSNTLIFGKDGILADNTDGVGFWRNIQQSLPDYDIAGQTALVLGAGGAARAVIWALLDAGAAKVVVTNRTKSKADELAHVFGDRVAVQQWDDRSADLSDIGFVVNTTALGMAGKAPLDMDLTTLPSKSVVTDIVYVPLETDLLAQAKAKGCATVDGLGMLLHQAAPGFEAWFGTAPTVDVGLRKAVLG